MVWALPVVDGKEITNRSKYHCFDIDNLSMCGQYEQNNDIFETNIDSGEILSNPQLACKVCYKKWRKVFNL